MNALFVLYIALSVFGVGVSVMDILGFLADRSDMDASSSNDSSVDTDSADVAAGDNDSWDAAQSHGDLSDDSGHQDSHALLDHAPRDSGKLVSRTLSLLRLGVWASFGAGPTGLFALLTGVPPALSLLWSALGAVTVASVSRLARFLAKRELDSTLHEEEFIMEKAIVSIPVEPGQMGKARLRRYDRDIEVYIRAQDEGISLSKGIPVILSDVEKGIYIADQVKE